MVLPVERDVDEAVGVTLLARLAQPEHQANRNKEEDDGEIQEAKLHDRVEAAKVPAEAVV